MKEGADNSIDDSNYHDKCLNTADGLFCFEEVPIGRSDKLNQQHSSHDIAEGLIEHLKVT